MVADVAVRAKVLLLGARAKGEASANLALLVTKGSENHCGIAKSLFAQSGMVGGKVPYLCTLIRLVASINKAPTYRFHSGPQPRSKRGIRA